MKSPPDGARATLEAVQTAGDVSVVGFRQCPVCGAALTGRRAVACSQKCRAARWRQVKAEAQRERDAEIRGLLREALRRLEP